MTCGVALAGALLVGATAAACGDDAAGEGWAGRVDSLPGGGVRVHSPAEGIWTPETAWRVREDLRIGSLEGTGPDVFGQVADVTVDQEGRIYVLEAQAHEVRVFGAAGRHVRTIGREGGGPGELNVPFGGEVFVDPRGRLWVNNSMNRRWDMFTLDGELLASAPQQSSFFGGGTVMDSSGALYQRDQVRPADADAESRAAVIRRVARGDSVVVTDTLYAPGMPERDVVSATVSVGSGGAVTANLPIPFVHQPGWRFDPAGHFVVEPGDGYRLVALSPDHDTLRIVERDHDPVPVTAVELDEALEEIGGDLFGDEFDIPRSRIPDHHPPFESHLTDATGHLWVRRILEAEARAWDVFDPEGHYLGEAATEVDAAALTVHAITDDAVYGVLRGELDEPYVVRLVIEKGERGSG